MLGDFNLSDINRDFQTAITSLSQDFIEVLRESFLIQHVTSPTSARASNTPHNLDLVITNDTYIEDIEYYAPLGKSDHSVLIIKCSWQLLENKSQKVRLNYDKGDYKAFKDFLKNRLGKHS